MIGGKDMDLREYIEQIKSIGELREIEGADWDLEIGTITELVGEKDGPVLLFDKIKDYPKGYRVLSNFLNNTKHVNAAFGFPSERPTLSLVRTIKEKFADLKPIPPEEVSSGPVLENVQEGEDVDLLCFPTPKWHELDGGRYLGTGCMVIMEDPVDHWVNFGTYRLQLHDHNTLGSHISPGHQGSLIRENYWAKGESCPVAVVFGIHPLVWIPSMMALPWKTSEYDIAGGLLGRPVKVIKGEYTGLPIPCDAEIVIEGECPPPEVESREEGPFGEWTGYYASGARNNPVIKVKRVMYRNDPVILGAGPVKPPASGYNTPLWRAVSLWQDLEDMGIPGIKGVWQMTSGGARFFSVISIEQRYAGHAKQVGTAAMSTPEGAYHGRFVIVVDEDIDPTNEKDVMWAVGTRCDPATSLDIVRDCWSTPLDPLLPPDKRKERNFTNSRAIIDACRPFHWRDQFPKVNRASEELRAQTLNKWEDLFRSL
jgi:4-hydroxy-3-polyprenylbenzoate decarboxylase